MSTRLTSCRNKGTMANYDDTRFAQRLECALCFELLQEAKQLICTHTFCQHCLAHLFQFQSGTNTLSCPVCREITDLEDGDVSLLNNFPLKSMIGDLASVTKSCTNCEPTSKSPASWYCQDCVDYLCTTCLEAHKQLRKLANHEVVSIDQIKGRQSKVKCFCLMHPQLEIELVCTSCNVSICFRCEVLYHQGPEHKVDEISEFRKRIQIQIDSLLKEAKEKMASIGRYIGHVDDQDRKVRIGIGNSVGKITNAYEDSLQQLTKRRDELIGECQKREEKLRSELQEIRKQYDEMFKSIKSASELIANGTKWVRVGQNLDVHSSMCSQLEKILDEPCGDVSDLTTISSQAEYFDFNRCLVERGLYRDDIQNKNKASRDINKGHVTVSKEKVEWKLQTVKRFPLRRWVRSMYSTSEGLVVTYFDNKGTDLITENGTTKTTILDGVGHSYLLPLSDGRYAIQSHNRDIMLYTPQKDRYTTYFSLRKENPPHSLKCVDQYNNIYDAVHVNTEGKTYEIDVFTSEGGAPIRTIPCHGYDLHDSSERSTGGNIPVHHMNHSKMLVIKDNDYLIVIDDETGRLVHEVTKCDYSLSGFTVRSDDSILIGWTKDSRLTIDLYSPQLEFVSSVLTNFQSSDERMCLAEFSTGEIAFAAGARVYVSPKTYVK